MNQKERKSAGKCDKENVGMFKLKVGVRNWITNNHTSVEISTILLIFLSSWDINYFELYYWTDEFASVTKHYLKFKSNPINNE